MATIALSSLGAWAGLRGAVQDALIRGEVTDVTTFRHLVGGIDEEFLS